MAAARRTQDLLDSRASAWPIVLELQALCARFADGHYAPSFLQRRSIVVRMRLLATLRELDRQFLPDLRAVAESVSRVPRRGATPTLKRVRRRRTPAAAVAITDGALYS